MKSKQKAFKEANEFAKNLGEKDRASEKLDQVLVLEDRLIECHDDDSEGNKK